MLAEDRSRSRQKMRIWNPYGMEGQENGVAVYGSRGTVHIGRWPKPWVFRVYDVKGKLVHEEYDAAGDHLGNVVARVGRGVRFDPTTATIPGDEEANRLLGREYRKHWSTPAV